MNAISLAYKNMKSNMAIYKLHFLALVFSVMAYYQFTAMRYNPEVLSISSQEMVATLGHVTAIMLLVFLTYFSWYSSSFFLNQRKKEIGLYTLMGVTTYKVGFIYAMENLIMSALAIIAGCGLGAVTGKFFMMFLSKYCNMGADIKFFVSERAIIETAIVFGIISLFFSLKGYINIIRSSLLSLINAVKEEESIPKASIITGVLSIIIIGVGYYLIRHAMGGAFLIYTLITTLLTIIGTYMFYRSTTTIILKGLIKNKSILYRKTNIMTISNLCYRIRRNYKVYATIAILLTCTLTALATVASLNYSNSGVQKIDYPHSLITVSQTPEDALAVRELATRKKASIQHENHMDIYVSMDVNGDSYHFPTAIVKYSDYIKIVEQVNYTSNKQVIMDRDLQDNEGLFNLNAKMLFDIFNIKALTVDGIDMKITRKFRAPLFGLGFPASSILVNDGTFDRLVKGKELQYVSTYTFTEDSLGKEVETEINKLGKDILTFAKYGAKDGQQKNIIIKIIYILGGFLALVFIMATGSIIYFKIITESMEDRDKYIILSKIGMEDHTIKKAIRIQIAMAFILPLITAIVHSVVAIKVLENMVAMSLNMPILLSILAVSVIFFCFYVVTTRHYIRRIKQ